MEEYVLQNEALRRIGGNKSLYKRLLQGFMNDSLIDVLAESVKRGDSNEAAKTAHAIKGASANLSLVKLCEAAKLLETGLKAGSCDENDLNVFLDVFAKTKEAVDKMLEAYEE